MIEITLQGRGPNTMSLAMLETFERSLDDAHEEPLLITGAGEAFSAGLDLDELRVADAAHVTRLLTTMERVVRKLFLYPAPTLAMLNGHAVAGGCLVAQCCDVRVCADDPKLRVGMTGVAIGLTYPPFVPAIFSHRVPAPHVETVLLGADRYGPADALRLGLVDEIAPRDRLREISTARLEARAKLPRHAYGATKRALREIAYAVADAQRERFEGEVLPAWTGRLAGKRQ